MGLELATTIKQLQKLWPEPSDDVSQGDDHLRLLKKVLKLIFPGANGEGFAIPITATEEEINYLRGVASNVQEQLNAKGDSSDYVSITGDRMTGDLIVENEIFAVLAFGGVRTGFNVIGPEGVYGGALVYNFPDKTLEIEQTNGQVTALETVATFKLGNIVMSSESFSTDPTDAKSLTTKEYVDSVATGGGDPGTGAFLPLTGGTLTGVLNCDDFLSIRNASGSTTSVGLNIFDKTSNSIKAFFGWDPLTSNLRLAQTEGSIEVADTILDMDGGKVSVTSDSGLNTSATENQHLTTKQYVDNAIASGGTGVEFLPLTGGQLSGNLIVNENVTVNADDLENYPGFDIDDKLGRGLARFIYDNTNQHVGIVQNGSPGSPPDTIAEFFDGKILMSSPAGLNIHNPSLPGHLVTKQYVDGIAGGSGFVSTSGDTMTGELLMDGADIRLDLANNSSSQGVNFNNDSGQKNSAIINHGPTSDLLIQRFNNSHSGLALQLQLTGGNLRASTTNSTTTLNPASPFDYTIKKYVDEFLQVGKGPGLADDMLVNGNYWAKAKVGDESAGFGIQNAAGEIVGGFYQTDSNNVVSIAAGPSTGQVHTGINLDEGQAMLFSNTTSITPNTPQSLTTKSYVDGLLAPPLAAIAAAEATIVALVAQVNLLQATVDAL